ncbi:MAG: AMP-binding protein [Xenococcaceae cyanobacterium]
MGNFSFIDILRSRALNQPNQLAFIFLKDGETEAGRLTYQELDQQARAIAAQLQSLGATGSRALLLYPSGLEFITAFFGCLYASVVATPAFPPRRNQNMSRLQAIVADAQATVALTTTSILSNLERRFAQEPELKALNWLNSDNIPKSPGNSWQAPAVKSNSLAYLQYTSGSTSTPKGVMVSHGNILHNSECIKQAFELTSESVSVSWLPHFHDMGLIDGIIQPLYAGFLGILMPPVAFLQQPIRWLQAISRHKATHCGGPNFGYDLCIRKITPEQQKSLDLSSWCSAYNGAEPLRRETLEQFAAKFEPCGFRANFFYPCYGMAETTLMVSGGLVKDEPIYCTVSADALEHNQIAEASEDPKNVRHLVGCGQTWLDQKIAIADPETLTQCPPDRVGEIWVSGGSVTGGYWNKPEETQKTFHAYLADTNEGPFLRTGDLGFVQNGQLFITGRLKDLIIIRGRNHYPQDIELTVEQSHPALQQSSGAAFAVEIDGIERLAIAQEVKRSYLRHLDVDEVIRAIRQAVSEQHQLQVYAVLLLKTASIPKTSSGKIKRHACRVGFLNRNLNIVGEWTGNTQQIDLEQLEAEVEYLWEQVQNAVQKQTHQGVLSLTWNHPNIPAPTSQITEKAIQTWLLSHLSVQLKIHPDDIDIRESFAYYGMDSSIAISITGELMNWLGSELEPTLFWEYPNIESLSQHLAIEHSLLPSASQLS